MYLGERGPIKDWKIAVYFGLIKKICEQRSNNND